MLKQDAKALHDVKDRVLSLLLMLLFLLLGVAWGVAVTAELKSRSTLSSGRVAPFDTTAIRPTERQKR